MSERINFPLKNTSPSKRQSSGKKKVRSCVESETAIDVSSIDQLTVENVMVVHLKTKLTEALLRIKT